MIKNLKEDTDWLGLGSDRSDYSNFSIGTISQRFRDNATELAFQSYFASRYINQVKTAVAVGFLGFLAFYLIAFYSIDTVSSDDLKFLNIIPFVILPILFLFYLWNEFSASFIDYFQEHIVLGINIINILWVYIYYHFPAGTAATLGMGIAVIILTFNYILLKLRFVWSIISGLLITLVFLVPSLLLLAKGAENQAFPQEYFWHSRFFPETGPFLYQAGILLVSNLLGALGTFAFGRLERQNYARRVLLDEQRTQILLEQEKSKELLLNILPKHVEEALSQNDPNDGLVENYDSVSIMFVDIVGFTTLSESYSPEDLADLLNYIFTHIDKITLKHGVEKIKTIGDAYMAVGGLYGRRNHMQLLARVALDIISFSNELKDRHGNKIDFRIGLNMGPAVAGVIGIHKFAFDLWGSSVNIASKMESSGEAGKIQVSESSYEALRDNFELQARGTVEVKNRGEVKTWWLLSEIEF